MYFKLEYDLGHVFIQLHEPYKTHVKKKHPITIEILKGKNPKDSIKCTASTEFSISNKLEDEFNKYFEQYTTTDKGNEIPSSDTLLENFKNFIRQTQVELEDTANQVINLFLWRRKPKFYRKKYSEVYIKFSPDNENWYWSPFVPRPVIGGFFVANSLAQDQRSDIDNLLYENVSAPICHDLLREASELKDTHPRSAFLIAIASLEASIQSTISKLIPPAEWLITNVPSPPVVNILTEYLPKLSVNKTINGDVYVLGDDLAKQLRKYVFIRNKIVHRGASIPNSISVRGVISLVSDIIFLLDYYCGHDWALSHVSKSTLERLKNKKIGDDSVTKRID